MAVPCAVEALRSFDHRHVRVVQQAAKQARTLLTLAKPPRKPGDRPWWMEHYANVRKIRDRNLPGQARGRGLRGMGPPREDEVVDRQERTGFAAVTRAS